MNSARREDGQSLIVVVIFLFLVIGMAGIVIDVAELYLTQRHLQSAADSAALAAAQDLPDSSLAACTYSASGSGDTCANGSDPASTMTSNGMNYRASFGSIQTTATIECLSVVSAGISVGWATHVPTATNRPEVTRTSGATRSKCARRRRSHRSLWAPSASAARRSARPPRPRSPEVAAPAQRGDRRRHHAVDAERRDSPAEASPPTCPRRRPTA